MGRLAAVISGLEMPREKTLNLIPKPSNPSNTLPRRTKNAIRIVIAEEQAISRQSLRALVQSREGFKVVGEAETGRDAVALAQRFKARVLLMDVSSSEAVGMDHLRQIVQTDPAIRVLILASPHNRALTLRAMELGARGVVLKTCSSDVLLEAIKSVDRGEFWVSSEILSTLIEAVKERENSRRTSPARGKYGLTSRENDMVIAVLEGLSNPEIADRFGLSEQTVKNHLSNVFDKLGVYSRLELALFAVNHRIAADSKSGHPSDS